MVTRGELNNNPMNIRISNSTWKGEIKGHDSAFETFDTVENGIRAGAKLLLNYFDKYKLHTLHVIINRWAPSNENDTGAYINDVSRRMNIHPDAIIDLHNKDLMTSLVMAIIAHENGELIYSLETIQEGVNRAYGT